MTRKDLNKSNNTFKRKERLKSKIIITSLFDKKEGSFFVCKPIKVVYKITSMEDFEPPKVAFTVSKFNFKRAVDRNFVKRKMREAYRLNNSEFIDNLEKKNLSVSLMFIFVSNQLHRTAQIEHAVAKALVGISA